MNTNYHPIPQPNELTTREKEDAMGSYLMMFASIGAGLPLPLLNLIASIIYYYIHKKKTLFVKFHTLQSLLSQLPVTLLNGATMIYLFWNRHDIVKFNNDLEFSINDQLAGYLIAVAAVNLIYLAFSIAATVKARQGRMYYFLFFGKIAYHSTFKVRPEDSMEQGEDVIINKPPV